MGTNYYVTPNRPSIEKPIHIGKASIGWMFCFQRQNDPFRLPALAWNTYEQVKEWLKKNVVDTGKYVIMDEYDDIVPFDELFDMIDRKQVNDKDNPDNFSGGVQNVNGYRFRDCDFS